MTLTDEDIRAIEALFDLKLDKALEERLRHIPSRDELFSRFDEIITELQAVRQEMTVQAHQIRGHEDRIQILEDNQT